MRANTLVQVGKPPATVQIAWSYFKESGRAYLLNVEFSVAQAAEGVELHAGRMGEPTWSAQTPTVAGERISITWSRNSLWATESGTTTGTIFADGRWELDR